MKKRFFYIVLIIIGGLIFLVHRCPKPAPAEKAAEYVTKLNTVYVPDSLKNIFEIEKLVESQRHMQEIAKDYLRFCKEYRIHTTGQKQPDNRFVLEKWVLIQSTGVCLARIVLLLRLFKQSEIDYDYIYGVWGKIRQRHWLKTGILQQQLILLERSLMISNIQSDIKNTLNFMRIFLMLQTIK